jgi:hypothetical protein
MLLDFSHKELPEPAREKFLTIFQDLSVFTVETTENDELSHELSIQKFTFHQSDKPVVSPCLF